MWNQKDWSYKYKTSAPEDVLKAKPNQSNRGIPITNKYNFSQIN